MLLQGLQSFKVRGHILHYFSCSYHRLYRDAVKKVAIALQGMTNAPFHVVPNDVTRQPSDIVGGPAIPNCVC